MTISFGEVPVNSTLYVPFGSYNSSGASVALTGLAVTDIEIYKDGSVTQRASDAGYTLLDTDGIDFDAIAGINGFSVDLSNNTTAGFYTIGSSYFIVVSSVTIDSQTVNFVAATFRIGPPRYLFSGLATAGSSTSFTVSGGSAVDDFYNLSGAVAWIVHGTGAGQLRPITDWVGSTGVGTVNTWSATPDTTSHIIIALPTSSGLIGATGFATGAEIVSVQNDIASSEAAVLAQVAVTNSAIGTPSNLGGGASLSFNLSDIEAQTDDIGVAGAGLTAVTAPSAATIAAAVWAYVIDGSSTALQLMRGFAAVLLGKASGLGTTNAKYRDIPDTKDVVDATVDADGNRTAVTRDLT